jgi:hypothetical protein
MWTPGSCLIQIEADLHRAELLRAARVQQQISRRHAPPQRIRPSWRVGIGQGLMRLGARFAGIDLIERARAF